MLTAPASPSRLDYKWKALIAVAIGTFMSTLDSSIVNLAMPTLGQEFGVEITTVEWVAMAYMLTIAGLLISMGRLSDMVGHKRVYNLGFAIFTFGSLLCAMSRGIDTLILFRVVQAVGAAMLASNGAAILTSAFPRSERGKAMGLNGTIVGPGSPWALRSVASRSMRLGGAPSSPSTFRLASSVSSSQAACFAPIHPRPTTSGLISPALSRFSSLTALLLALSRGEAWGWSSTPTVGLFALSLASLILFVRIEMRVPHRRWTCRSSETASSPRRAAAR